jgi:hypothetical protein
MNSLSISFRLERLDRIKHFRWELDADIPEDYISNCGPKEGEFLLKYDNMLKEYINEVGLDFTKVLPFRFSVIHLFEGYTTTTKRFTCGSQSLEIMPNKR